MAEEKTDTTEETPEIPEATTTEEVEASADAVEAEPVTEEPAAEAPATEEPAAEAAPEAEAEETVADAEPADEAVADAEPADEAAETPVAEAAPAEAEPPAPQQQSQPKKKRKLRPRTERRTRPKNRVPSTERKPVVRQPKPERERGRTQERRGVVVSAAMDKTIVVRVDSTRAHPRYQKVIRRSKKFHAHDEQNQANVGDVVRIVETRPLSKTKNWRLAEVLEVAK